MVATAKIIITLIFVSYVTDKTTSVHFVDKEICIREIYGALKIEKKMWDLEPLALEIFKNVTHEDVASKEFAEAFFNSIRYAIRPKLHDRKVLRSPGNFCYNVVYVLNDDNIKSYDDLVKLQNLNTKCQMQIKSIFIIERFSIQKTIEYAFDNLKEEQFDRNVQDENYGTLYYDHVKVRVTFQVNLLMTPETFCDDPENHKNRTARRMYIVSSMDANQGTSI